MEQSNLDERAGSRELEESILRDAVLLRGLVDTTEDAVVVCDEQRRIRFVNDGAARMFGISREGLIGSLIDRLIPEELSLAHQEHMRQFAATGERSRSMRRRTRIRGRRADGSTFPAEVTISKFQRGEVWFLAAVVRDSSERQREEERFRALVEGTSRSTGHDFFASLVASLGRVLGMRYVVAAEAVDERTPTTMRTLAVWERGEGRDPFEYEISDGSPCAIALEAGTVTMGALHHGLPLSFAKQLDFTPRAYLAIRLDCANRDGVGLLVAVGDEALGQQLLPEQLLAVFAARASAELERLRIEHALRRTEETLRQAQKLEALGHFASGIAHDFNNILTIITCAVSAATELLAGTHLEVQEDLEQARAACALGAQLVRKLMVFSRRGPMEQTAVDLKTAVRETSALLRRVLPAHIHMLADLGGATLWARGDAPAVQQSLINLAMNAADAMPTGGALEISIGAITMDAGLGRRLELQEGRQYVTLSVRDTGTGMTAETVARAFEPFYTTKESGRGTGLGLSMVFGLLQKVGGSAEIESAPGCGTRVTLYFEAADLPTLVTNAPAAGTSTEPRGGSERVLVVGDEWAVRRALARVLEEHGYDVSFAADGREALGLLHHTGGSIALVVTDFEMSRMDGAQLFVTAERLYPQLRFMIATAGDESRLRDLVGRDTARLRVIPKPLTAEVLLQTARELLDGEDAARIGGCTTPAQILRGDSTERPFSESHTP